MHRKVVTVKQRLSKKHLSFWKVIHFSALNEGTIPDWMDPSNLGTITDFNQGTYVFYQKKVQQFSFCSI